MKRPGLVAVRASFFVVLQGLAITAWADPISKSLRDAQFEDLETARTDYVLRSNALSPLARQQALELIASLESRAGKLTDAEFLIGISRLVALADNGHDSFDEGGTAWMPNKSLPFRMIWFPDGMVIARTAPERSDLVGALVLSVEGVTPDELFHRLRMIVGGTDTYRTWDAMWMVGAGDILYQLGLAKSDQSLRVKLRLADGRTMEQSIPLVKGAAPSGMHPRRIWTPELTAEETERGWKVAVDASHTPLYLQEPDQIFRIKPLPELNAVYVQFRANLDYEGHRIRPFVDSVRSWIETHHPRHLIYDLRFDTGGDITITRDLIRSIPAKVPGRIYALIGRFTFSAGIVSAAALKHDGGGRVTLVGENVGDRLRWWSEGKPYHLVHADLWLHPSTGLWDLSKGCKGEANCYGDQLDATVDSLDPEICAPLTAKAWLAGRDPGMEAILKDLERP